MTEEPQEADQPGSIVAKSSQAVHQQYRIVRFRGRAMVEQAEPFPHFTPLHKENFDRLAYPILGGVSRSRMGDVFSFIANTAEDLTPFEHMIGFGMDPINPGVPLVWDMDELRWLPRANPNQTVWRSPYAAPMELVTNPSYQADRLPFIMALAGNDPGVYDDIMQSLAPLIMAKKPDGVIWWVGEGANGKSTLMDAIYRIFPGQLSSITVKRLVDGRDTPSLNGTLANVVKESSEGRVEDTEIYKSIGTHENFRVHKFHSQDDIEIRGDVHHIFSANTIPAFNDKGYSARRRTFIVPFTMTFDSDPTFEERTFTPEMFGALIAEMARYAVQIREQGYRYKWSAVTMAAKNEYDMEANNAAEYAREIIEQGVVAFESFGPVKMDYENWCADNGYVPLGINTLRRAVEAAGFERLSYRDNNGNTNKHYRLPTVNAENLMLLALNRPGLYTTTGFAPKAPADPEPVTEEAQQQLVTTEPVTPKRSIINGRW